ncbi:MAG: hypothetical protein OWU33_10460 [Firmicutes bacterium]|nr:hypothetical protein [Bacillota bacterium]
MANAVPRTLIQESHRYTGALDLPMTDMVMVYGLGGDLAERLAGWRDAGYRVGLMIGLAWGEYPDFLDGQWNGVAYRDRLAQRDRSGAVIFHGESRHIPYLIPSPAFGDYLSERLAPLVASGVEDFFFEEPEFWVDAAPTDELLNSAQAFGWSERIPKHLEDLTPYDVGRLKQFVYAGLFRQVARALKAEGSRMGKNVRCYVATHSLINYAQWRIVSPETEIFRLDECDGAIAQVWTGTSRTPTRYRGERASRPFFTALLEYGYFAEWQRAWGKPVWAEADPVEDNPQYGWTEYRDRYLDTLVASLLHEGLDRFELCPWPYRIFQRRYGGELIPPDYHAVLRVLFSALQRLNAGETIGEQRIGILVDDNVLCLRPQFERASKYDGTRLDESYRAEERETVSWNEFFGLALPLLMAGHLVYPLTWGGVVQNPAVLDAYSLLIESDDICRPLAPHYLTPVLSWVERGGRLTILGPTARWEEAGLVFSGEGSWEAHGRGSAMRLATGGSAIAQSGEAADAWLRTLGIEPRAANPLFVKERGPYLIGWGQLSDGVEMPGLFVDITRSDLPVLENPRIGSGGPFILYRLSPHLPPGSLVGCSVPNPVVSVSPNAIRLAFQRPRGEPVVGRVVCPAPPDRVHVTSTASPIEERWDPRSATYYWFFISNGEPTIFDLTFSSRR